MKTLKDYSEDIYKCSKCGLCQAACPIFEETGLETAVSRGKFTLLNGIINGKIDFTQKTSKYLDLCLGCKACFDFCPSGISADDIIIAARYQNNKINGLGLLKQFIISNFDSKFRLSALKFLLNLYRNLGFVKLTGLISKFTGLFKGSVFIFNSQVKLNIKYKKMTSVKPKSDLKIAYFPGCIGNFVNHSVKNAIAIVLEKNGFGFEIPENLSCCGVPARNSGDLDTFIKLAKNNLDKISSDIDYLITDCASCGSVWKIYEEVLKGEYKEKAALLAKKAVNINKFLALKDIYIPENAKLSKSVTYHDPCHLKRYQGIYNEPREILKNIPGLIFIEMDEADKCCGAAGTFCITKPEISNAISKRKAKNILNTKAQIVSTSCPSCKIGISKGLAQLNVDLPVYQPVELLAELYSSSEK